MTEQTDQAKKFSWLWFALVVIFAIVTILLLWWWRRSITISNVCSSQNMSLSIGKTYQEGGTTYIHAVLENDSSTPCNLGGYPSVSLLGAQGNQLGEGIAKRNDSYGISTVVLDAGDQAYVLLSLPAAYNFSDGVCSDVSTTLRMYLPEDSVDKIASTPLLVSLEQQACPGFSVSPILAGK